jgi:hypothetical protein
MNLIRFLSAVDRVQGGRTIVFPSENVGVPFRDWSKQFTESFRTFVTQALWRLDCLDWSEPLD